MTTPAAVLELRGLTKRYGDQVAVAALDLALRPHEFMTFLGPSGSGKTTTLMMVAGLQRPDAGSILLDGKPVDALPPYRRDLGMVFQNYALFPHMTVRRNVAFPLEMRGTARSEIERLVTETLGLVGLPGHGARLPRELSGGQQQRVALARALIYRPSLLLMDEPLGALDKQLRAEMQLEIKRVHRERRMSVLYVTHDQEEALTLSDRIAVFNAGRIEQVGTPDDLYERPATRFVASFVGETNVFPGRVAGRDGDTIRVDGLCLFQASAPAPLPDGAAAVVTVRPERLRLVAPAAPDAGLRGVLQDVIYVGNGRKAVVELPGGQRCTVLVPADQTVPQPGAAVGLAWSAVHATAFPAGP